MDGGCDPSVAAFAGSPVVKDARAKGSEVATHQLCDDTFDRRKILVAFYNRKQGIGAGGQVGEMVARCRHHEVKVAIYLFAVALRDYGLESGGGLFKGGARLSGVASEFA